MPGSGASPVSIASNTSLGRVRHAGEHHAVTFPHDHVAHRLRVAARTRTVDTGVGPAMGHRVPVELAALLEHRHREQPVAVDELHAVGVLRTAHQRVPRAGRVGRLVTARRIGQRLGCARLGVGASGVGASATLVDASPTSIVVKKKERCTVPSGSSTSRPIGRRGLVVDPEAQRGCAVVA